ncbi:hypothetical protein ACYULU_13120 [Breznakiellaceae bacterium SP9]
MVNTIKSLYKILFIVIFIIYGIIFIINYQNDLKNIKENYIKTEAEINNVFPSGRGNKMSTILTVKYTINENKTTTIRRSGYKEGVYNIGDKIIIYINPNNYEEIK